MALSARTYRMAGWVCWAGAVVSLLLLLASLLAPFSWAGGKWGVILAKGEFAVGQSSHDVATDWPDGVDYPVWQFAGSASRAQVWAPVAWRPSRSEVTMSIMMPWMTAPTTTHTFDVQWLPLSWPLVILATAATFLTFWARRIRAAGLCHQCGYDLRGHAGGPCPECGIAAAAT